MRKIVALVVFVSLAFFTVPAFAEMEGEATATASSAGGGDYQANMRHNLVRGFKNVIGSPLEIFITIQEYHEKEGRPVIRHAAGFIDGAFQGVVRLGSGLWDFVAAFLPGHQEGMPVDPETLF